jgi:hypothetical protein
MERHDQSVVHLRFSAELARAVSAYATLHNKERDEYVLGLVLDGIESEGHAKLDLRQIPEIQDRGGPKMRGETFVRSYSATEPPGRLYNSKGLAARLGVSRHMIYTIKRANAFFASRGEEKLIFHGRMSSLDRITEWLDRHGDWAREYHVRKPEPPPEDGGEVVRPSHIGTNPQESPRGHGHQLRAFQAREPSDKDELNLHGDSHVGNACRMDWRLVAAIREAASSTPDTPYKRNSWTSVSAIRKWLIAHPEFTAARI